MLKIKIKKGQSIERALKLFKRKFKDTKVLQELKEKQQYTKKSRKKRIQKDKAIRKLKKERENNSE